MDKKYIDEPINKYLDDLAAKKPAPGGGSVGAFADALAAGLVSMVANFSLGKDSPHEERLEEILKMSESLREKASRLIDEDIKVYEEFSSVFKLPKESLGRKEKIQEALKNAARVPLEITELGVKIMQLNKELFPLCNPRLVSDIGVSLSLAYSGVEIGALNVEINLASIKDEQFNKVCRVKLENSKKISRQIKNEVYPQVEKKII
jgi:formiminotetrahydrofolate cyclodeaminase